MQETPKLEGADIRVTFKNGEAMFSRSDKERDKNGLLPQFPVRIPISNPPDLFMGVLVAAA